MGIEYSRSKKTRRKFKLLNVLRLIGGILIVFLLSEGILLIIANIIVKPITAKWGLIEKGYWTEALFLRNEKILMAPSDGYLMTRIQPGVRVQNGELIAYICTNTSSPSPDAVVRNLDMQMRLMNLNRQKQDMRGDLQRIGDQIRYMKKNPNKFSKKVNEDLESLEKEQARRLTEIKNAEVAIANLTGKLNKEQDKLSIVTAPGPGYLFYQIDHWEDKLTPKHYLEIMEPDFRRNYAPQSSGNQIKAGEIIGKVIDPFRQIIVVPFNSQSITKPNRDESWWLKTAEGNFKVTVLDVFSGPKGKTLIALEDTTVSSSFLPGRRAKFFVVYRRTAGVSIPVKAIYRMGHVTRVKIMDGDSYRLKDVKVLETDGETAIVKGINFGTIIISR